MAVRTSKEVEEEAVETGASMMALTVRTAPKTRGIDLVKTAVLTGADLEPLAGAMERKAVGAAAKKLHLLDADLIIGIPLSVTGKNPFFDRP